MKKSLKKKWLKALRSGDYEKGVGFLCADGQDDKPEFCCLGVLADIEVDTDWIRLKSGAWALPKALYTGETYTEESPETLLSPSILEQCGLTAAQQTHLARLNDLHKTFEPVIQYIEEKL